MSSNPWINHVKSFSQANGLSYRDALRHPHCKGTYSRAAVKSGEGVYGTMKMLWDANKSLKKSINTKTPEQIKAKQRKENSKLSMSEKFSGWAD